MRITLLLSFIFSFCFAITPVQAKRKDKVYTAKVYSVDKKVFRGTLQSADDKGVYLTTRSKPEGQLIALDRIKSIKIKSKSAVNTGFTVGLLTGLAAGTAGAVILHSDDKLQNTGLIVGGLWVTFLGGVIGGKIGGHPKEKISINGNSQVYAEKLSVIKNYTRN